MMPFRYSLDIAYLHSEFEREGIAADVHASDGSCVVYGTAMRPLIEVCGEAGAVVAMDFCPGCSYVQFPTLPSQEWMRGYCASRWDAARARPKALADDTSAYANSIALLRRHAEDPAKRIFDLGAGYGVFMKRCAAEGYTHLIGIEASPRRARHCADIGLAVTESTGETMADDPVVAAHGPFDVVHSSHVMEHVYDLRATMTQIRLLLKPGGVAIVVVPNLLSENLLVLSQGIFHIRNFTTESLRHLFAVCGFDVLELNTGDSLEIVARMAELPDVAPAPDAAAADRLLRGFAARLGEELGVAVPESDTPVAASVFVSRPPRRHAVWRGRSFPAFSKPGLLRLIFGTGFRETPIFGPQGNLLRGFDPRNIAFKLRRRLFGIGRLEIAAALRVQGGRGAAEAGGAPLTIRFPGPAVPVLLK
jgi:SAM-dependent methyltransferase